MRTNRDTTTKIVISMATHATHQDWLGSWCDIHHIDVTMDIVHVQMMATTRTEHRFYAYNSSGDDQQAINCEYNHSVKVWNAGVNDWELVNRDSRTWV